jgi:superfamily II DNA/RNA helicase
MTFDDLGLSPNLLAAIKDAGYTTPTPIQAGAIPVALSGRDVLGIAQTGTGKTASFTLPLIERLSRGRARARMPRSLILCPTRELADQVAQNVRTYAKNHKLTMALLIGGVAFAPQKEILDKGADILIATPGRLLDHFERGGLMLMGIEIMIVDEADRMLDMGFIPDIEKIFSLVPPRRQTLFFSATMPNEIVRIVNTFLKDPERVEVSRPAQTAETIKQYIVRVADGSPAGKRAALRAAIRRDGVKNGIVFCNRKRDVDTVARSLQRHGFSAAPIHGDLAQVQRMKTLDDFKTDQVRILVASDVAARGLDIPAVSHVFNFDIPRNADDYVHRIGRTGRAGLTGESVTLVTGDDKKSLANVAKLIGGEPETLVLDGTAVADITKPASVEPEVKASRSRRGGRGGRSRSEGEKPKAEPQPEAAIAAPEPANEAPRERAKKPANDPVNRRRKSETRKETDGDAAGFGDHVPEFLLRSALG